MNAHRTVLSEDQYDKRRKFLQGSLRLAESELIDIERLAAVGELADDAAQLEAARRKLADAEARLRGLELAREESERILNEEEQNARADARNAAIAKVEGMFDEYMAAAEAVQAAILNLRPHMAALAELPAKMILTLQPHQSGFHPSSRVAADMFQSWLFSVRDTRWLRSMIDGSLYAAGFGRLGFVPQQTGFDAISAEELKDRLIKNILVPLAPLVVEDAEEEPQSSG